MKRLALGTAVVAAMLAVGCQKDQATTPAPEASAEQTQAAAVAFASDREKQSYATGAFMGQQMIRMLEAYKELGMELDAKLIEQGIVAGLNGSSQIDEAGLQEVLTALEQERMTKVQELQEKAQAERDAELAANKAAGDAFLAENAAKEGIMVTESGLQYEVLAAGEGDSPVATDQVKVHYRGTLIDGSQFDSSYDRNAPAVFFLNQVIPGWTEGVQLMKPGAKYKLYIPSDLGYGEMGSRGAIPGNAALIFEVELLEINPEPAEAPAATPAAE
ncbi:FKBP-type peptidyl-prolyl cis-trans isomerase [Neiella marina]|uniref:Peptidyl-prolyl cis-trans isomerase n=1 Tax=Neiella holothuriorum TaxID=2870530 RepID=A0ABS7ECC0_9GAMM|nr:FKBP-type peptidyl-prolyl cis-trans isomerase [Neiella holothuriorum]MBW8189981.1 FKBP-type peptidyl-prolyl cis-trans isomerase [Neiella holothuriorum]